MSWGAALLYVAGYGYTNTEVSDAEYGRYGPDPRELERAYERRMEQVIQEYERTCDDVIPEAKQKDRKVTRPKRLPSEVVEELVDQVSMLMISLYCDLR